jgi:hypothetical protein
MLLATSKKKLPSFYNSFRSVKKSYLFIFSTYITEHRPWMSNLGHTERVTGSYTSNRHVTTGYVYNRHVLPSTSHGWTIYVIHSHQRAF